MNINFFVGLVCTLYIQYYINVIRIAMKIVEIESTGIYFSFDTLLVCHPLILDII